MEQTHILVATDFSQSSLVAVQTAARLVQTLNGKVTMLHCIERHRAFPEIGVPQVPTALSSTGLHPYESALSGQQEDLAQAAREALARICNDHFPQIEAKLAVIHDDSPVDGICRYAEAHGIPPGIHFEIWTPIRIRAKQNKRSAPIHTGL